MEVLDWCWELLICQGADTVFSRMTAEILNMDISDVHIQTVQDTDNTIWYRAYASRQLVTGTVVPRRNLLKEKILVYARATWRDMKLRLDHGWIMAERIRQYLLKSCIGELLQSWQFFCYYSRGFRAGKENTIATGCCFAEVEVDIKLGKIKNPSYH